jgi:serine/threonine protein kinase
MNPCKSGEYGYIFHPSIHVNNGIIHEDASEEYITKIQKDHNETLCEIEIGKIIQTLPHYEHYFAPIMNSEHVYISPSMGFTNKIQEKNKPKNSVYISNKILYVGQDNIDYQITKKINELYPLKKILNTHLHLLDAIEKLQSKNIIHMDLKCNNIMWDNIQNIPIIIDFGLSRIMDLENPPMNKDFFITYENYEYWCIDIYIISQIVHDPSLSLQDDVNQFTLKQMYNTFLNNAHAKLLGKRELRTMEIEYTNYFSRYIQKTWGQLVHQLLKSYKSWDNYALSIIYLYIITRCLKPIGISRETDESKRLAQREKLLRSYMAFLQEILMSTPDKRPTPEKTRAYLLQMFS